MGHKEQLLEGAKRCLAEKGYARTTARDIVAASGTNLASIGYHYGSKEALLNAAMVAVVADFTDQVLSSHPRPADATPVEAFQTLFAGLLASFPEAREALNSSIEAYNGAAHSPELRAQLAEAHELARRGLAAEILGVPEDQLEERHVRTLGSLMMALYPGVMVQFLVDPDRAPSAEELVEGLRTLCRNAP
ncbi:TetR/AcrR family transcriptional regulator [Microlunatus parietis]|uniref:AcrR family transcriptional regulator n=1 Tax=Microlunatus parietis TaxID=682979 RepID=A0A7Y9I4X8_9ACTN|nr:TetR/AcrR family transcriptional regulator [Microlunatus parietis]NYE70329.1 AcrR family transcriptional regulator [Microlunatus parietis]